MRAALAILCTCVLLVLGAFVSRAQAGDYRYSDSGYYPRHYGGDVWYSSKCCYKKTIRHVRTVRYVRIDPYRRHSYYDSYRPWREGYYHRPVSHSDIYVDGPRRRYVGGPSYDAYEAYNAAGADVAPRCYQRRAPVPDGRGGWLWGVKQVCY
jgi:hypothetical protein